MKIVKLYTPTEFGKMSMKQLAYFSRLLLKKLGPEEVKMLCLLKFTGLKLMQKSPVKNEDEQDCYLFKLKNTGTFLIDVDRVTDMLTRLDFLDKDVTLFDLPETIGRYNACDSRLYGIRLDEWLLADRMYGEFSRTKDVKFLNLMLAVFYRETGEQWNDGDSVEKWARRFRWVPLYRKYIVFLWYTGVKLWLINKYWHVFNGGESTGETPGDEMIMGLLSSLNDGKVADNNIIKSSEVHEALYELNRKIEYSKKGGK